MARHDPWREKALAYPRNGASSHLEERRPEYYDPDHVYRGRDRFNSGYGGSPYSRHAFGASSSEALREGRYRGCGPKGYARSDERIREDICDDLTDAPYVDASNVEVLVRNGEVTLSGTVENRQSRRHAEDLAEGARGVLHVQNNLRVAGRANLMKASTTPLFKRTGVGIR